MMKAWSVRILSLLMALLMFAAPGLADEVSPIEALALELQEAQSAYTQALLDLADANETVASLEAKYEKNEDDVAVQDQLIDAMIVQEEAQEACNEAEAALLAVQAKQAELAEDAECEDLIVEYEGKYADLLVTVTVDENMVVYALTVEVDGSERDQLVGENDYLYQFIGKTLPVTIGDGKDDDVRPLSDAQQTSKDLVSALNSLVYVEEEASGPIIEPQAIADYIFRHGELPDNFITKKEAQNLGWDSSYNYVSDVAPGKSIGGDRFGNYEGLLPDAKGRTWYEADCYYTQGKRNAYRILFSNDGLVYYTDDHYESFTQMFPSWE